MSDPDTSEKPDAPSIFTPPKVYLTPSGAYYRSDSPINAADQQLPFADPIFLEVLAETPTPGAEALEKFSIAKAASLLLILIGLFFTAATGVKAQSVDAYAPGSLNGIQGLGYFYNPTELAWDRARANYNTPALQTFTSQAAGTVNSATQTNYNFKGTVCTMAVGSIFSTSSSVTTIQGFDPISATFYNIIASTAVATGSTNAQVAVYPGLPSTANVTANYILPAFWRTSMTMTGAGTFNGTIACSMQN